MQLESARCAICQSLWITFLGFLNAHLVFPVMSVSFDGHECDVEVFIEYSYCQLRNT